MKFLDRVKESIAQMLAENEQELRPIKSIEVRKVEPVYNFTTATHTYLLARGLVVHNCDTISMLMQLNMWRPSSSSSLEYNDTSGVWEDLNSTDQDGYSIDSYIV